MDSNTIYEVVKKLTGNIEPIGETQTDAIRLENLKTMTEVVNKLLTDIDDVAYHHKDSHEFSRKQAGQFAKKFLDQIGIED